MHLINYFTFAFMNIIQLLKSIANINLFVTIQPSLRPDANGENPLFCVYGDTFISF